jgi:hypothetical protein
MHGPEKSDLAVVAVKPANKAGQPAAEQSAAKLDAAEPVERRVGTKGNADQQSTSRTQSRISVSQAPERIRQAIAVWTRGRSRVRESRKHGSVRGALGQRASLPLQRRCRLLAALRDTHQRLRFMVGIGWGADMEGGAGSAEPVTIDPKQT